MFLLRYPFFLLQYNSSSDPTYEIVDTKGVAESVFNQDRLVCTCNNAYMPTTDAETINASSNPAYNYVI